jgi:hypothetical protein
VKECSLTLLKTRGATVLCNGTRLLCVVRIQNVRMSCNTPARDTK